MIDLLAEGRAAGLTAARVVADRVVDQLERLLAAPAATSPIVTIPTLADEADRSRLLDAVERHVRPADARFLEALRDYLPATREEPGMCALPDGEARYAAKIRAYTSLDLAPDELHRVGLEELAEIEAERKVIARGAGYGDDTSAYRSALNADPAQIPPTPEALVARCQEDVDRAIAAAPRWFSRVPKAGCEVRRVEPLLEKDAPGAYYYPPTMDGGRPGIYFVNAYDLPSRTYWSAASTTYHEAVPGHHFQIALEMELQGLPAFRTLGHWPQGRPTSRAGRSTRSGWPTRPASSGARPIGSGCSTARPCARCASSSTPASTPSAGAASGPSRRWSRRGSTRRTRASRPTATSPGPARPWPT